MGSSRVVAVAVAVSEWLVEWSNKNRTKAENRQTQGEKSRKQTWMEGRRRRGGFKKVIHATEHGLVGQLLGALEGGKSMGIVEPYTAHRK